MCSRPCKRVYRPVKETSICGYIGLMDLTRGDIIRSRTYEAFLPLIAGAIIYLVMVVILSRLVTLLERSCVAMSDNQTLFHMTACANRSADLYSTTFQQIFKKAKLLLSSDLRFRQINIPRSLNLLEMPTAEKFSLKETILQTNI